MTTCAAGRGVAPAAAPLAATGGLRAPALVGYGLFGIPLAMAALPVYVHLPRFYGSRLGVDLAALGGLLLCLRLADGLIDPVLGAWSDRLRSRKAAIACAAPVLALGIAALFAPVPRTPGLLLAWLGIALALVYVAFSVATINHNAWGALLSADPAERTRITAVREGLALAGVVAASLLPTLLGAPGDPESGLAAYAWWFAAITLCCTAAMLLAPAAPRPMRVAGGAWSTVRVPLADPLFRRLLVVFVANGIASAIPATLVLFFIADVLQAEAREGVFLALYFVAAAAGMPLWTRLSARVGTARAWSVGMIGAVAAFVWTFTLGAGDTAAYAAICALSGLALGADLALPPALVATVIARAGRADATGAYFGVWTLAAKLNLALAAGLALPLLAARGYVPGARDPGALAALAFVYAALPCLLKLGAIAALHRFRSAAGRWA
jgi:glycoside/pentoside/hexuronide:cation symporter, GPH family